MAQDPHAQTISLVAMDATGLPPGTVSIPQFSSHSTVSDEQGPTPTFKLRFDRSVLSADERTADVSGRHRPLSQALNELRARNR
jgi:hypothetical protein